MQKEPLPTRKLLNCISIICSVGKKNQLYEIDNNILVYPRVLREKAMCLDRWSDFMST